MAIIVSLLYLFLIYGQSVAIGMSGSNSIMGSIKQEPILGLSFLILLFGLFATTMWYSKSRKKEDYKIWFYLSTGPILFGLLTMIILYWPIFLRGLHF